MGLFDKLKETAEGAFEDVKDKVSDATGVDVDSALDAAGSRPLRAPTARSRRSSRSARPRTSSPNSEPTLIPLIKE